MGWGGGCCFIDAAEPTGRGVEGEVAPLPRPKGPLLNKEGDAANDGQALRGVSSPSTI